MSCTGRERMRLRFLPEVSGVVFKRMTGAELNSILTILTVLDGMYGLCAGNLQRIRLVFLRSVQKLNLLPWSWSHALAARVKTRLRRAGFFYFIIVIIFLITLP